MSAPVVDDLDRMLSEMDLFDPERDSLSGACPDCEMAPATHELGDGSWVCTDCFHDYWQHEDARASRWHSRHGWH